MNELIKGLTKFKYMQNEIIRRIIYPINNLCYFFSQKQTILALYIKEIPNILLHIDKKTISFENIYKSIDNILIRNSFHQEILKPNILNSLIESFDERNCCENMIYILMNIIRRLSLYDDRNFMSNLCDKNKKKIMELNGEKNLFNLDECFVKIWFNYGIIFSVFNFISLKN